MSDECFTESAKEQVTKFQVNIDEVHATSTSTCTAICQQFDM